ncbi:MAG: HAMP domain-containing histidine kinase [Gracilibacteraceae bacterium]|jgi:signal transduction histidine kinase|nr:HAMP domain-containing histidine kinase [Gracilibacteraceae bacterium]
MKTKQNLWLKISILCIGVLCLAVMVCGALITLPAWPFTPLWRLVLAWGISILVGGILIFWLVRRALKPFMDSRQTTAATTDRRQEMFIRGLMHELKTPLTAIMLHTDTLLSANLSQADARNSLAHIYRQSRWLDQMSQKLYKLIKLEEATFQTRPEDIPALLEDVKQSTADTLRERQTPLKITCETDSLPLDYDLIKTLLINLVDNASKASAPGQQILLRAYSNTLEMKDSGYGIPADEIAFVTDPFYMVDTSRNKSRGGSGLGLALSKRIADAHKAQLHIESAPNAGTTVRVVFPEKTS